MTPAIVRKNCSVYTLSYANTWFLLNAKIKLLFNRRRCIG